MSRKQGCNLNVLLFMCYAQLSMQHAAYVLANVYCLLLLEL